MTKPAGGRGNTAPYHMHQTKVPVPIVADVKQIKERFWNYIANGGDPLNPPSFLGSDSQVSMATEKELGGSLTENHPSQVARDIADNPAEIKNKEMKRLSRELKDLRAENQELKEENNHLRNENSRLYFNKSNDPRPNQVESWFSSRPESLIYLGINLGMLFSNINDLIDWYHTHFTKLNLFFQNDLKGQYPEWSKSIEDLSIVHALAHEARHQPEKLR